LEELYESNAAKLPSKWGYWKSDGYFYSGYVARKSDDRYLFEFDDGQSALLSKTDVITQSLAVGDSVQADWEKRGTYYSAVVQSASGRDVRVRYDADGIVEDTDVAQIRVRFVRNQ
jgi:hypothetical protein